MDMDSSMDDEEFYEGERNGNGIAILSISSAVLLWVGFFLYYFSFISGPSIIYPILSLLIYFLARLLIVIATAMALKRENYPTWVKSSLLLSIVIIAIWGTLVIIPLIAHFFPAFNFLRLSL